MPRFRNSRNKLTEVAMDELDLWKSDHWDSDDERDDVSRRA